MSNYSISVGKPEQGCINEDAAIARKKMIAVSDGAGGGGLFAERWSSNLLEQLPFTPIHSAEELDAWIGDIWEMYYNKCEEDAKQLGGLSLDKFYDEGSFATLVAVWQLSKYKFNWISFGDSVAFHYNYRTKTLEHSFGSIADFDKPPFLINCKDELRKEGFRHGIFNINRHSVVFAASDALSHYIMMMYEIAHKDQFYRELKQAEASHSKNENYLRMAMNMPEFDFEKDILNKFLVIFKYKDRKIRFQQYITNLIDKGLIAIDDYSLAMFRQN